VGANDLIIRSGRKTPIHFFLVGRSRALVLPSGRDVGMIHTYRLDLRGGPTQCQLTQLLGVNVSRLPGAQLVKLRINLRVSATPTI
jgi:hypothetical protein